MSDCASPHGCPWPAPEAKATGPTVLSLRSLRLSFVVAASALGCDRPSAESNADRDLVKLTKPVQALETNFGKMARALGSAEPGPCSDVAIREAVERNQNRTVPFIDVKSLALSAAGKPLDPALPLASFVSEPLVKRRPSSDVKDEQTATDAAFDTLKLLKEHDFLAAFRYQLKRPKADGGGFHGGRLEGRLALFELRTGKLMCATDVFAVSNQEIEGKADQSPQQAADKDFELESRSALQQAFSGMTQELNLDLR